MPRQQLLPVATAIAATLTLLAVRTPPAATITYDYTGTVTDVAVVCKWLLRPGYRDRISGSYSYDDAVLSPIIPASPLTEFSLNTPAFVQTLNNFFRYSVSIVDLTAGNIAVGVNSPVFLPGGC